VQERSKFDEVDWLIVRGSIPPDLQASLDHFQLVRDQGEWALFKRR
jgi:hypothetical protein